MNDNNCEYVNIVNSECVNKNVNSRCESLCRNTVDTLSTSQGKGSTSRSSVGHILKDREMYSGCPLNLEVLPCANEPGNDSPNTNSSTVMRQG